MAERERERERGGEGNSGLVFLVFSLSRVAAAVLRAGHYAN